MVSSFHGLLALLAPVHRLLRANVSRAERYPAAVLNNQTNGRPRSVASQAPAATPACRAIRPPVRVVRIVESGETQRHCGRLMISGRMADVCAELDRMVEREAALGATG